MPNQNLLDVLQTNKLDRPTYLTDYNSGVALSENASWYKQVKISPNLFSQEEINLEYRLIKSGQSDEIFTPRVIYEKDARTSSNHYENAVIMLASQFNGCETTSANMAPCLSEYVGDKTQGPQAQLATPLQAAARIKAEARGELDLLSNVKKENGFNDFFEDQRGYLFIKEGCWEEAKDFLQNHIDKLLFNIDAALVYGESTSYTQDRTITQICCAAIPVGYMRNASLIDVQIKDALCEIVLTRQYEMVAKAAIIKAHKIGQPVDLVLTGVGAGVFGNNPKVVAKAIKAAVDLCRGHPVQPIISIYSPQGRDQELYAQVKALVFDGNEPAEIKRNEPDSVQRKKRDSFSDISKEPVSTSRVALFGKRSSRTESTPLLDPDSTKPNCCRCSIL